MPRLKQKLRPVPAEGTVRATNHHVANYWTVVEPRLQEQLAAAVGQSAQPHCLQQNKMNDLEAVAGHLESFGFRHRYRGLARTLMRLLLPRPCLLQPFSRSYSFFVYFALSDGPKVVPK